MRSERRLLRASLTRIFLSAQRSRNLVPPYQLLTLWQNGRFTLLTSEEQCAEVDDVLHRPHIAEKYGLSEEDIASLFLLADTLGVRVALRRRLPLRVRDPKDEHILAAALGGKADYIVTGDDDLLALGANPKCSVS